MEDQGGENQIQRLVANQEWGRSVAGPSDQDDKPLDIAELKSILERIRDNEEIAKKFFEIEVSIFSILDFEGLLERLLSEIREKFGIPSVWISLIEKSEISDLVQTLAFSKELKERLNLIDRKTFLKLTDNRTTPLLLNGDLHPFPPMLPKGQLNFIRSLEGLVSFLGRDKKRGILKGFVRDFVEQLYDLGVKIAPSNLKDSIQRLLPRFRGKARSFITQSIVDWKKTLVYSGENIGTLRVNLKGKDPNGQVSPEEYDNLLKDIIKKLESLENPLTKERLIDKVYRRDELYSGEYVGQSPDLIIWPKENKYRIQKRLFRKG